MNVRGLFPKCDKTKVAQLSDLAATDNAPFVALQETHLTPDILSAEVQMAGYTMYRADREGGRSHGGVATYVRDDLTAREIFKYSNNYCESQVLEIKELEMLLLNIYRPPSSPKQLFQEVLDRCQEAVEEVARAKTILMVGDYNFPFIRWPSKLINAREGEQAMASEKEQGKLLIEWTDSHFLEQIIMSPTRKENILDLVFTNTTEVINRYKTTVNSKLSDHNTLTIYLNIDDEKTAEKKKNPYPNTIYEYDLMKATEGDWIKYEVLLEKKAEGFELNMKEETTDNQLHRFIEIIEETVKLLFEKKGDFKNSKEKENEIKRRNKIPRQVRTNLKKKRSLSDQILISTSASRTLRLMTKLQLTEQDLKKSYQKMRTNKENDAIKKIKRNPKYFYSFASKSSKIKNKVGPLIDVDGEMKNKPEEMVEILKKQYDSVFSEDKDCDEEDEAEEDVVEEEDTIMIDDIQFSKDNLAEAVDQLSDYSGPGPDGISAILLKKARGPVSVMLETILHTSLKEGKIPDILKLGFICPIQKPEAKRELAVSWRPISLTSHVSKTMERVLRREIVNYLEVNELMDPNQHGSRQKRSCLSQLLEHYEDILKMLETGGNVDVIYTDLEKAYDKVSHSKLINKLENKFKIKGKLLAWIKEFLNNRQQQVIIDGRTSSKSRVKSGSVQGSVLGPVLFLMYISDMTENVEAKNKKFVDDTKVLKKIEEDKDVEDLQEDLDKMFKWQTDNSMKFNGKKFQVMRYGADEDLKNRTTYFTENMEDIIQQFSSLRDLGIIMSDNGKFDDHVDKVVKTVRRKIGWILRTFNTRRTDIMKQLWKTLVQCHVDFCSQLYKPGTAQGMAQIEKLFFDFSAKIPEIRTENYWARLKKLKMLSQERRMDRYRIFYIWKILEKKVPNCGVEVTADNGRLGRKCLIPKLQKNGRKAIQTLLEQTLQVEGARLFNCMPKKLREIHTLEEFKVELDQWLATIPDEPRMGGLTPSAVCGVTGRQSNSLLAWTRPRTNMDLGT